MKPRRVGLTVSLLPIAMLLAGCALPIAPPLLPIDRAVTLEPDEGALVVEIESNALVQRLELQPVDGLAVVVTLTNIAPGRNAHLIVLPKGAYRWAEVDLPGCDRCQASDERELRRDRKPPPVRRQRQSGHRSQA